MNFIESIILGLVQGITEFFPISSSGHLLIGMKLFNINEFSLLIEVALHIGTMIAIIIYWRKDYVAEFQRLKEGDKTTFFNIIVATIPAGIIGLFFKEHIEKIFYNSNALSNLMLAYLIMSFLLYISKFYHNNKIKSITYLNAFIIGVAQCIAIIPGFSRSGFTITAALLLGVNFKNSMKFSFMLAIPILFFAGMDIFINNFNIFFSKPDLVVPLFVGMFTSIVSGYYVLAILEKIILENKFWYFSFYCLMISILLLIFNYGN